MSVQDLTIWVTKHHVHTYLKLGTAHQIKKSYQTQKIRSMLHTCISVALIMYVSTWHVVNAHKQYNY